MIKIVIVDDHQLFLDGIVSVLSNVEKFKILFVETKATEALKKIKNKQPDIVITDISMPEMNGLQFIKILKSEYPKIKILAISMFKNMQSYNDIDGFLLKETGKTELINTIKSIVLKKQKYGKIKQDSPEDIYLGKAILSIREKEIIQLIAKEYTSEEIAEKLQISKHTIEAHRKNIFFKLQVKNTAGLVNKAMHLGFVK
jgi:DNA-binding NarL/FixJ family response regulator